MTSYQHFSPNNVKQRVVFMRETCVEDGDVEILLAEDLDDVVGTGQ